MSTNKPLLTQRNVSIDLLRLICSFLVVFIHAPLPSVFGTYVIAIGRISVPIFLMISGYYFCDMTKDARHRQIIKILKLICFSSFFYFVLNGVLSMLSGQGLNDYLKQFSGISVWKSFFIFNDNPFSTHLWYLSAALYALIIIIVSEKLVLLKNIMYWAIPILLCASLLLPSSLTVTVLGRNLSRYVVRNFIFVGIPYYLIGILLRKGFFNKIMKIGNSKLIWGGILFFILYIIEIYWHLNSSFYSKKDDYFWMTPLLACIVFIIALKFNNSQSKIIKFLGNIGKRHSAFIYIIHPAIISVFVFFISDITNSNILKIMLPFAAFLVSVVVSLLHHYVKNVKIKL